MRVYFLEPFRPTDQPVVFFPNFGCHIGPNFDNFMTTTRYGIVRSDTAFHQNPTANSNQLVKIKSTGIRTRSTLLSHNDLFASI